MAYGEDRQELATDTFDTEINSTNWASGQGSFGIPVWVTGGHVEGVQDADGETLRRITETYDNDQWSCQTVHQHNDTNRTAVGPCVRLVDADTSDGYFAACEVTVDEYQIWEVHSGPTTYNELTGSTAGGTDFPFAVGDTVTLEVVGTAFSLGSDAGGTDVEKMTATDATHSSGRPGTSTFENQNNDDIQFTAWNGGNKSDGPVITAVDGDEIWADGDTGLVITGSNFV